jgi:tetratricopeptide (TPR) repeat protein
LHERRTEGLCAAAVGTAALALYAWTLAPTVTLVDSGELIVAARSLGVAHPPGFPLYVLLAHLATWVPLGNVAQRVNFASAAFAALAIAVLAAVVAEALRGVPRRAPLKKDAAVSSDPTSAILPPLVAALLLAFSRTLWSYATLAEVYTLNALLILLVLFLMLRWRQQTLGTSTRRATPGVRSPDRLLQAAAFVFGLGLGVHHVTVALMLPGLALLVVATAGWRFFASRRLAYAALCAGAGLSVYLYLPIAAWREAGLNWGDPRTLQRIWWHLTGKQYQAYFSFSPGELGMQAVAFARHAAREFGPWWCPGGPLIIAIGCGALFRRDRVLLAFLGLVAACNVAYTLGYAIAEDMDAYYLPTYIAAAIAAGAGAQQVLLWVRTARWRRAPLVAATALLLVPVMALAGNFRFNDRSQYWIARDYVDNLLRTIEPDGLLLTLDWQVWSPLLYTRTIERERRDVTVIDVNLMRRSWYFDYLRREYPALLQQNREAVAAFLEDLTQWEQDPELYQRDAALNQRIDTRFRDMIMAFVQQHLRSGPVYITQDIALNRSAQDVRLTQALAAAYQLVPQGLVFQLVRERAFRNPAEPPLITRGLADGTLHFEPDDVVRLKVFPVYISMLYNRGRYLSLFGDHARAADAFRRALALDPSFAPAQSALARSLSAMQKAERPGTRQEGLRP